MNLNEWKKTKLDFHREEAKKALREDLPVSDFLSEEEIAEIKSELEIENYQETVYFEESIDLSEYFETDLNDEDCECPEDEEDCSCPEVFYDFIPDEYGEMMDLEFELYDNSFEDDGIVQFLKIKDAIFADDFEVVKDVEMEESFNEDPLEHGMTAVGEAGRAKIIFRRSKGTIVKRKRCPRGTRIAGTRCVPQTASMKAGNRRKGIKLKRAMKRIGAGAKKRASIRRKITKKRVTGRSRNYSGT